MNYKNAPANSEEVREQDHIAQVQLRMIDKIYADAEKRYEELEHNYNDTGSNSTYRTMTKYENIKRVCELARYAVTTDCPKCAQKKREIRNLIGNYEARAENGKLELCSVLADLKYLGSEIR